MCFKEAVYGSSNPEGQKCPQLNKRMQKQNAIAEQYQLCGMCLKTLVLCLDLCIWHGTKEALGAFKPSFQALYSVLGCTKNTNMLKVQVLEVRKSMCTLEMNTNLT